MYVCIDLSAGTISTWIPSLSESDKLGFKLKCVGFLPALVVLLPSGDAGQGRGAREVGSWAARVRAWARVA